MRKTLFLLFFLSMSLLGKAQADRISITGTVYDDTSKEIIEFASIRVLNAKDSSYVTGTTTNTEGKFTISTNPGRYIVQISFLGYDNEYRNVRNKQQGALGNLYLKENGILLGETVVTAKAIEMLVKGDTLEYNADSYKVQESAVVEDLLKKMPGVEVSDEGKITVNGKEVKKILLDGKEFFTDDPKVASKNLPASMVDKLQVVDRKSDMTIMTGFDDGDEETVINLTVKPGMKQGVFGNAFAGMGNKDRYEGNAMVNYMRNSTQVTALGGINNTNNAGFTDFASNMFGGGRPPRGVSFGGRNGVAKSITGGLNFATEHSEKFKWNGNVQYGSTDNDVKSTSNTRYRVDKQTEISNKWGNNDSKNIRSNFRFEWSPDSLTKIIFRPDLQYNRNTNSQFSDEETMWDEDPLKGATSESKYFSSGHGLSFNGNLDFSRKLNQAGRVLSFSLSGGMSNSDSDGDNYLNTIYNDPARADSIIDQRFTQDDNSYNWRAYASFVEPLSRNNYLQLAYSIRSNRSEMDKLTYDRSATGEYDQIAENYTRNVENDFLNQNVTLSFKSVRQKFNYTLGLGLEPSSSKTDITAPNQPQLDGLRKNFLSFAPDVQFNYLWDKRHNLRVTYKGTTNQPSTLQLYDGITSVNGLNETRGNPNLRPSFVNRFRIRYQKFQPEKASTMMLFANFNHTMNDIVSVYERNAANGRDITYANIDGNFDGNGRFIYNTPLKNKKFSFNSMTYGGYTRRNTLASGQKSRSNNLNLQENIGLQFRSDKFDFTVRGNIAYNNIKTSPANDSQSADTYNYGGFGSFTWYLPYDFTLDSDMNYSTNSGYSSGFKQDEWLWNASLSKQVFKNKGGTIRFKMYDILKQRSNISRSSDAYSITDVTSNTISSYFMVYFAYKLQIFSGGAKSSDMGEGERGRFGGGGGGRHRF